jgi:hypothetical protein
LVLALQQGLRLLQQLEAQSLLAVILKRTFLQDQEHFVFLVLDQKEIMLQIMWLLLAAVAAVAMVPEAAVREDLECLMDYVYLLLQLHL